jgi:hypothetical protein
MAWLFFLLAVPSAQAGALPWSELEVGSRYQLAQEVRLGESPVFPVGMALALENQEPLSVPGEPLEYFEFRQLPCANPETTSEIEIVLPAGNEEASSVGVELQAGCLWGIYVESKDLFTPSIFGP